MKIVADAEPLGMNFLGRRGFNSKKRRLLQKMEEANHQFSIAEELMRNLIILVDSQKKVLDNFSGGQMLADTERTLITDVQQEIQKSDLFLDELDKCKVALFHVVQEVDGIQKRLVRSLRKSSGTFLAKTVSGDAGEILAKKLMIFYALKTYVLVLAVGTMLFSTGHVDAAASWSKDGIVSLDAVTDWLIGLPATIMFIKHGPEAIKKRTAFIKGGIHVVRERGESVINNSLGSVRQAYLTASWLQKI